MVARVCETGVDEYFSILSLPETLDPAIVTYSFVITPLRQAKRSSTSTTRSLP